MRHRLMQLSFAVTLLVAMALIAVAVTPYILAAPPDNHEKDRYIVVLRNRSDNPDTTADFATKHGAKVQHVYHSALRGFSAMIPANAVAAIESNPQVLYVVADRPVQITAKKPKSTPTPTPSPKPSPTPTPKPTPTATPVPTPSPTPVPSPSPTVTPTPTPVPSPTPSPTPDPTPTPTSPPSPTPTPSPLVQQASTGLRRIGASTDGIHQTLANKGAGIGVAVVDTGVDLTHPDLAPVVDGVSCVSGVPSSADDNGHGSHVAGIIAARDNGIGTVGVAPAATLYSVKVLNSSGTGSWSDVICGIDWVIQNAKNADGSQRIQVMNLSLGGSGSSDNNCGNTDNDPLHQAICAARDAGITIVTAAGNSGTSVSTTVPAAYSDAVITVSALTDTDGGAGGLGTAASFGADDDFASFSAYGSAVTVGAPGVAIYSTYRNDGYVTMSGTSMAAPFVTGSAVLDLQQHPGSTWLQVKSDLISSGETGASTCSPSALGGLCHEDTQSRHPEPILRLTGF